MLQRASGVLLPVSALPGKYGIGNFGKEARGFIEFLEKAGFHYWQILPIGRTDNWNSPYNSVSAFAGNPYYIDLDQLVEEGLLTKEEAAQEQSQEQFKADYAFLAEQREMVLRKAYSRISGKELTGMVSFWQRNREWLQEYTVFMARWEETGTNHWVEWEQEEKEVLLSRLQGAMEYYAFEQYIFYKQWAELKQYANEKGIQIIGDMPIYVSLESCDVWGNQDLFELDEKGHPTFVAGVPPDYFCADGQLWGNPLYNWERMQADGYAWWLRRISFALSLYDAVRIDHFRGFSSYWSIPGEAKTAKEGSWKTGPGMDFFQLVEKAHPNPPIIAEDLGIIDDEVRKLLQDTGFPGMRVMQFGFEPGEDSIHLPHQYTSNNVAYTGTHDNTTFLGWLWDAAEEKRRFALDYCRFPGGEWGRGGTDSLSCRAAIQTLLQSSAGLVIIPIQDICGFGGDTAINHPGTTIDNWTFRLTKEAMEQIDIAWLRHMNELYRRI